jgi:hypothetical protein
MSKRTEEELVRVIQYDFRKEIDELFQQDQILNLKYLSRLEPIVRKEYDKFQDERFILFWGDGMSGDHIYPRVVDKYPEFPSPEREMYGMDILEKVYYEEERYRSHMDQNLMKNVVDVFRRFDLGE